MPSLLRIPWISRGWTLAVILDSLSPCIGHFTYIWYFCSIFSPTKQVWCSGKENGLWGKGVWVQIWLYRLLAV